MRYLRLHVRYPVAARHPMHQFIDDQEPAWRSYLRHWNFSDPAYVTSLFHVVGDVAAGRDDYLAALDAVDTIREYDVTPVDDRGLYVYVREDADENSRRLRRLFAATDLLVVPPIEYGPDGEMVVEIAGEPDDLQTVVAEFPDRLDVSVDRVGEYDAVREPGVAVLTDRQAEVLDAARAMGYYEVPRRTSVREIADELDCAKSTVADHLRKAEARLVGLYGRRSATHG